MDFANRLCGQVIYILIWYELTLTEINNFACASRGLEWHCCVYQWPVSATKCPGVYCCMLAAIGIKITIQIGGWSNLEHLQNWHVSHSHTNIHIVIISLCSVMNESSRKRSSKSIARVLHFTARKYTIKSPLMIQQAFFNSTHFAI